jgi:broad specificity phosphatase PhoE
MRLYLITHAHTQQEPAQAVTRWHLSATGAQQAEILAQQPFWEQVQRIVLSSEIKTHLTVEPLLTQRQLPITYDARFDELHRGAYGNFDYVARVAQAFARPDQPAGEWEPASAAQRRFLAGIDALSLYRAHLLGHAQVKLADWRTLSFAAVALADPIARTLLQDFQPVAGESPRG